MLQQLLHLLLCLIRKPVVLYAFKNVARAEVRRKYYDGVLEVYDSALRVGKPAVVEHLQQHIEHVGVRLFYLIEQYHAIRLAAYGFRKLAAFVIADVARRRAYETRHGVFLHIFGHIYTHHIALVIKQRLRKRLCELGLAHAGRAEEQEASYRLRWILKSRARTENGVRNRCHRFVLTYHALMKY